MHCWQSETHYSYTPSDARAARALCGGEVRAERAPRDPGTLLEDSMSAGRVPSIQGRSATVEESWYPF